MEQEEKMYLLEYQRSNSKDVYEELVPESGLLDSDGPLKFIQEKNHGAICSLGNADEMLHEEFQQEIDFLLEEPNYSFKDYRNNIESLIRSWNTIVPNDEENLPFSELTAVKWLDKSGNQHLVVGKEPLKVVQDVFDIIKDADRLSIREVSREEIKEVEERFDKEKELEHEKAERFRSFEDILRDEIKKAANLQLDGKTHWMFTNEPSFRAYFVEWVKERVELISESRNMEYNSHDIEQAIGIETNCMDRDLSHPMSHQDSKDIFETIKMLQKNDFKNAENYPWIIQPSSDPKYPYDWVLWNDQYPIVQYSSENQSIDPCLEIGEANLNEISTVIRSAAHKKNGHYILSAADKEKVKNSGRD